MLPIDNLFFLRRNGKVNPMPIYQKIGASNPSMWKRTNLISGTLLAELAFVIGPTLGVYSLWFPNNGKAAAKELLSVFISTSC